MTRYSLQTATPSTSNTAVAPARIDGEVAYIQRQQATARGQLEPATWADAKPIVAQLFTLPMADGLNDKGILGAMRMTVEGEPLWVIREVVANYLTGRCGRGFCPSSAELGIELRKRTDPIRERLTRAQRMASDRQARDRDEHSGPLSDAGRQLARDAIARLKAVSAAEKATTSEEPDQFAEYRVRQEEKPRLLPLTTEDVAHVADAPKRGMQRIPVPSFEPFSTTIRGQQP